MAATTNTSGKSRVPALLMVGLNHRTAPVEIREQYSIPSCARAGVLNDLVSYELRDEVECCSSSEVECRCSRADLDRAVRIGVEECVIVSTCNRFEVYAVGANHVVGRAIIESYLAELQGIDLDTLRPHLYFNEGQAVVGHLMKVAAGLDSMILGEPQIQGQVSSAFEEAKAAGTTGPILSHLFAAVAHAGKRARTETEISRHTASVSHAAANLAEAELGNLSNLRALVVGTGEMAELAIDAMVKRGLTEVACINRTYSSASALARRYQGKAYNWYHLPKALKWADVVITATGAPHAVIGPDDVKAAMHDRRRGQLLFIDIAVPRDVADTVAALDNVILYDIDHLRSAVDESLAHRRACVPDVEAILADEVEEFLEWLHGRRVAPVIVDMRKRAEILAAAELEQTLSKIGDAVPEEMREPLRLMTRRIVNKVLHEATVNLKSHACRPNSEQCAMRSYVQMLEHERAEFARTMGWDSHEAIQPRIEVGEAEVAGIGTPAPNNGTADRL